MTDWDTARANMVESQIRPSAVTDRRLIAALMAVPRERFIPAARRALAYCDADVDVSGEDAPHPRRHLIAPMPFARMVQLADIGEGDHVLDIGCTSGYSCAVIAALAGSVVALEENAELATRAQELLADIGIDNVAVIHGPLQAGYDSQGPYDAIILEGSVDEVPEPLFDQIAHGGRLIAVMPAASMGRAYRFVKSGSTVSSSAEFDARLSPLPGFERAASFVF